MLRSIAHKTIAVKKFLAENSCYNRYNFTSRSGYNKNTDLRIRRCDSYLHKGIRFSTPQLAIARKDFCKKSFFLF